jgi:putative acetyltransferase
VRFRILDFEPEFYDQVLSLWRRCDGIGLSGADSFENICAYLERNSGMSFVAIGSGEVVGAALSGHDGRRGYIHHLAVRPAWRGHGVGRRLADRCLQALERAGIQKCHLFIYTDNEEGMAFWRSIGWTPRAELCVVSKSIHERGG